MVVDGVKKLARTIAPNVVTPEMAERIADNMFANQEALTEAAGSIIEELNNNVAIDPKVRGEVADIIERFAKGEDINIEEILEASSLQTGRILGAITEQATAKAAVDQIIERGRAADLDRSITVLDNEIGVIEDQIEAAEEAGTATARLQTALDKKAEQRDGLEQELADIKLPSAEEGVERSGVRDPAFGPVFDSIKADLMRAGRTEEEALADATIFSEVIQTQAEAVGQDPMEFFRQFGFRILASSRLLGAAEVDSVAFDPTDPRILRQVADKNKHGVGPELRAEAPAGTAGRTDAR